MIRKSFVIAILVIFCLTATSLLIIPTRSQTAGQYDPWLDWNDDGKINLIDVFRTELAFGTSGDPTKPVNVTNWETDCYHHYSVEIVVDTTDALPGNVNPVVCYVHITYQGLPIRALVSDNFQVCCIHSPFGDLPGSMSIYYLAATAADGCYIVNCQPPVAQQWIAGMYVFYIGVCNPAPPNAIIYNGVTMASFKL